MQKIKILGILVTIATTVILLLNILSVNKEPVHINFDEVIVVEEATADSVFADNRIGVKMYEQEIEKIDTAHYYAVTDIEVETIIARAKEKEEEDLRYLSAIIFAEASTQCYAGQVAVGIIVMNRSDSSNFADGICNVLYQSGQFTPASNGALSKALAMYDNGEIPESCIRAAQYALSGKKTVSYNGVVYDLSDYYFFSRYIKNARLVIEDHMFR